VASALHLRDPPRGLYKEVWFLMGFYLISFELVKIQICRILLSALSPFIIVVCKKKWHENSRALSGNVQVGDNWSSTGKD
jgi:hypothetical protein